MKGKNVCIFFDHAEVVPCVERFALKGPEIDGQRNRMSRNERFLYLVYTMRVSSNTIPNPDALSRVSQEHFLWQPQTVCQITTFFQTAIPSESD